MTHLPCRSWCPICVQARGRQHTRPKQQSKPITQLDFGYVISHTVGQNQWYPFFGGRCTTHLRLFFVGIGMFTGDVIWVWTHGQSNAAGTPFDWNRCFCQAHMQTSLSAVQAQCEQTRLQEGARREQTGCRAKNSTPKEPGGTPCRACQLCSFFWGGVWLKGNPPILVVPLVSDTIRSRQVD